jgi:hypothetical protein
MIRLLCLFLIRVSLFGDSLDDLIDYALKNSTIVKQSKVQEKLSKLQRRE